METVDLKSEDGNQETIEGLAEVMDSFCIWASGGTADEYEAALCLFSNDDTASVDLMTLLEEGFNGITYGVEKEIGALEKLKAGIDAIIHRLRTTPDLPA